ncbi:hypothetical protein ACHAW6_003171 [Cyclotella cf. meneghiniana]
MPYSPNVWKHNGTANVPPHQAFGITSGDRSCLYSLLMSSACNMLTDNMLNTSCMPSRNITPSPLTGLGRNLLASMSHGTIPNAPAT